MWGYLFDLEAEVGHGVGLMVIFSDYPNTCTYNIPPLPLPLITPIDTLPSLLFVTNN